MWRYSRLPEVFDDGSHSIGIRVTTEEELARAMMTASQEKNKVVLIEACLAKGDCSAGLKRLGEAFRRAQQKKK